MTTSRGFFGLTLLIAGALAATGITAGASDATSTAPPHVGNPIAGKEAFTEYCSVCHGAGAQGFIGPKVAGIDWTTAGLHAIVRGGVGGYGSMPAFNADAVSDRMIADIATYLASLSTPPPTPSTPPTLVARPTESAAAPGADMAHGAQIYAANCAACHGAQAQGGVGPSLRGERSRKDTAAAIAWIKNPQLPMPRLYPTMLSEKDVADVAAYVESL